MTSKPYRALVAEEENGSFLQRVKLLQTSDLPENDLLIRVYYSSLNYKDALSATGNRSVTRSYPFTPGIDASGVVEKSRDSRFNPGDKVLVTGYDLGMNTPGGFGQYISVSGDWVIPMPEGLSLEESMIIGTSGLTAAIGVEKIVKAGITPGSGKIVVTGSTGGVGSFAVGLLGQLGYSVIAVTGKPDQVPFLKQLGAEETISRKAVTDVPDKPLLASAWVAALDTVGGEMLDSVIRQTAHNGVVTCCGNVLGHELCTNVYPFILRGVSLMGIDSGITLMNDRLRIWNLLSEVWKPGFLDKICRRTDLENLPAEIKKIAAGGQTGTVLVDLKQP